MARQRLDTLVAERGLAPSRTAAASSIRAGMVRIGNGGERALKPGQVVDEEIAVTVEGPRRYVSRGGLKLEAALDRLELEVGGRSGLDIGASTGGFTDCMLERGAVAVVALDVGHGQLDWKLRQDPRVTVVESFNARDLGPGDLERAPELVTIDVSFISLAKILEPLAPLLAPGADVLAMVKPQFELGQGRVGKGGVVRDPAERLEAVLAVAAAAGRIGLLSHGVAAAGLPGPKGNLEIFLQLRRRDDAGAEAGGPLTTAELTRRAGEEVG